MDFFEVLYQKWVRICAYQFFKVANLKFRNIKIRKSWDFYGIFIECYEILYIYVYIYIYTHTFKQHIVVST